MASDGSFADIPRHELVAAALDLGVGRPDHLSAEELAEFIRAASSQSVPPRPRETLPSWLAVARNLVASVVEQGLNLPEAARVIRATVRPVPRQRPPLPTVTLAQIYLAQKHTDRAKSTLDQVLQREPDNFKAQSLVARLNAELRENEQFPSVRPENMPPQSGAQQGVVQPSAVPVPSETPAASIDAGLAPTGGEQLALDRLRSADTLLLLRHRDSGQLYVYWELSEASVQARTRTRTTNGAAPGIQLSVFAPSAVGAIHVERWLPVTERCGVWIVACSGSAVARAYLGEKLPAGQSKIRVVASNYEFTADAEAESALAQEFCASSRYSDEETAQRVIHELSGNSLQALRA